MFKRSHFLIATVFVAGAALLPMAWAADAKPGAKAAPAVLLVGAPASAASAPAAAPLLAQSSSA